MIDFHKSHGKVATMMVTTIEDPSKYGVVVYDENSGRVTKFVEKPKIFVNNKINTGLYIFSTSILDTIELKPHYLEKDIFPKLCREEQLYCCHL